MQLRDDAGARHRDDADGCPEVLMGWLANPWCVDFAHSQIITADRRKPIRIVRIAQECLLILSLLTVEKPLGRKLKELRSRW
jgi:hypothetical protein